MIQAFGLTSNARKELPPVVDDVSFEACAGRVTALLGAPGAGKTTALGLMLELQPGRGITYFRGRPLHRMAHPSREVGVVLGDVPGHPARTVRGHLRMLCAAVGVPSRRADEVLEAVGLVSLRDERVGTLSRGMDRRLGLACALLADPHTLVLDDPAHELCARESRWLHDTLRAHAAQGGTVLFTTADPKEAARAADRVVTLEQGKVVADQEAVEFARTRLRPRVAVRSPHAARLAALLAKDARTARRSVEVVRENGNRLLVFGSTCADVGDMAFRHGIVVHQLADEAGDMGVDTVAPRPGEQHAARDTDQAGDGHGTDLWQPPDVLRRPPDARSRPTEAWREPAAVSGPASATDRTPGTHPSSATAGELPGNAPHPPAAAPRPPAGEPFPTVTGPCPPAGEPKRADDEPRPSAAHPLPAAGGSESQGDEPVPSAVSDVSPPVDERAPRTEGSCRLAAGPHLSTAEASPAAGRPEPPAVLPQPAEPPTAPAGVPAPGTPGDSVPADSVPGARQGRHAGALHPAEARTPGTPSALPPPISVRSAPSPLRPLRYEIRRAAGTGTGILTGAAVLLASALTAVLLARIGHTPQPRLLAAWPRELPLPPAALGAGLLGALAFGDEFRHPALAADRGTVPRRLGLLTAKLLVSAATALLLAVLTVGCDTEVLHLFYGRELAKVPADWLPLSAGWLGLVVGCAWAGVLAAGLFRSITAGLAAVVAVPVLVVPVVRKVWEGPSVRSAAGLPLRLREVFPMQWPFGGERYVTVALRVVGQPVGSAMTLSLTALLCAYLLMTLRGRVR
ncbi:ABC transporter [Streptomyces fumigatiscleroticus]|nr:ABC transporter [Streptomyces fumigatiscleroticus]